MHYMVLALASSAAVLASPAMAQQAVKTLEATAGASTNDGTTFTSNPDDTRKNSDNSQSYAKIVSTSPLGGNGAIEISGNRSRVYNDMTGLGIQASSLGSLTGTYQVDNGGAGGIQSPAFRVYVNGANTVSGFSGLSELIWEASSNSGYTLGATSTVNANDLFWRQIVGQGFDGTGGLKTGGYVLRSLAEWGDLLGGNVLAIGVGNGGCPGDCSNFKAYADNLALTTDGGTYRYDFQSAAASAVPEPTAWALMILGFGAVGTAMRRQRRNRTAVSFG